MSGKHTEASADRKLNSTEAQVREDCNVYCEEYVDERYVEEYDEIAESWAVIKDSWDFFRMGCSLLRDGRKYDEVFRRMQLDPVYPYLDSMKGMNESADDVPRENAGVKRLSQVTRDTYYRCPYRKSRRTLSGRQRWQCRHSWKYARSSRQPWG